MPSFKEWIAPTSWTRIEVISDLHLSAQAPRTVDAWEQYLRATSADAVFILGDLFEAWVGDDCRHLSFESHCVEVLAKAALSRTLAFMAGNRDFLVGPEMLSACGMQRLEDPTVLVAFGERYVLTHGDTLCLADTEYQEFRLRVRDPAWQREVLARPLVERHALAHKLRVGSIERQLERGDGDAVDIDTPTALEWLERAQAPVMIHGHTHRPATHTISPGRVRHVLSDWSLDHGEPFRAEVLRIDAGGLTRLALL